MASANPSPPIYRPGRDFWKFWVGQTISNLGSSFTSFALPLLVFKLTGSALNLAYTSASYTLPYPLFGLVIGAWIDRVDRKCLMILTDIARALVIAAIPLLVALHSLSVWMIYAVSFIASTLSICFDDSQFAAIPSLVRQDDLVTANGRIQASYSAATVLGPLLAGSLIALIPIHTVLWFDSLSFFVSAGSLALIRTRFNSAEERAPTTLFHDIVEGLRYVLRHPVLRNISAMMALVNFLGSTPGAQMVLFAKQRLHASDVQLGLLQSAGSVGIIVLSLAAGPVRKRWPFSRVALGSLKVCGLMIIALALTRWYWAALPLVALWSGFSALFNLNTGSLRQAIVPNHLLGRVVSIAGVLALSAMPLGSLAGGVLIERTHNVALVYGILGALVFLVAVAFSFTPLGHAERFLPVSETGPSSGMSPAHT